MISSTSPTLEGKTIRQYLGVITGEEMQGKSVRLGANAIVGIDLDYEVLGQHNGMLMVTVSGTAVTTA